MKFKKPTYEEYCKASRFAKVRFKFGVYIQIISFILLLFLLFYTITNIEEMKTNPIDYAEEKMGVTCLNTRIQDYGSNGNIESIREG